MKASAIVWRRRLSLCPRRNTLVGTWDCSRRWVRFRRRRHVETIRPFQPHTADDSRIAIPGAGAADEMIRKAWVECIGFSCGRHPGWIVATRAHRSLSHHSPPDPPGGRVIRHRASAAVPGIIACGAQRSRRGRNRCLCLQVGADGVGGRQATWGWRQAHPVGCASTGACTLAAVGRRGPRPQLQWWRVGADGQGRSHGSSIGR